MPRLRNLGTELRAFILQHAIRQEALTAEILKLVFRILKAKTKTFGNSGSSISFQNKIDFLHDLEDITDTDYKHFKKLLEIRNQFAHNYKCNSFTDLGNEKKEYLKHLHDNFGGKWTQETNIEKKSLLCYIDLFKYCHKLLLEIKKKYLQNLNVEIEIFQSHELLTNNFSDWISGARKDFEELWSKHNLGELDFELDKISLFAGSLDIHKYKLFADILEKESANGQLLKNIFRK